MYHIQFNFSVVCDMSLNIIILALNGRRKTVKVSPNAVISESLEEFCKREKLDVNKYSFLFQRKILDERLSWRYANVPNNAKLEVVKHEKTIQETPVKIALQYEGNRFQHSFLPDSSLMDILTHWKNDITKTMASVKQEERIEGKDDLSTMNPEVNYEPSILYMRREVTGHRNLATTNLKSFGLTSGNAVLRLSYKMMASITTLEEKTKSSDVGEKMGLLEPTKHPLDPNQIQEGAVVESHQKCIPTEDSKISENVTEQNDGETLGVSGSGEVTENEFGEERVEAHLEHPAHDKKEHLHANYSQAADQVDTLPTSLYPVSSSEEMDVSESASSQDFMDAASSLSSETMETRNARVRARSAISATEIPVKKFKATPPSTPEQDNFSNFKFPETTKGKSINRNEDKEEVMELSAAPCDREYVFYEEREADYIAETTDDIGDEFFEVTVDDIRKMLSELRYQQKESEEKPLSTAKSRELQRLRSINHYPKIVIRIVFPNRAVLQGIFRPAERLNALYDFVRSFLSNCLADFYLYTTPPRFVLKDKDSLLYDCNLSPASKVYFGIRNREFTPAVISEHVVRSSSVEAEAKLRSIFDLKRQIKKEECSDTDEIYNSSTTTTSNQVPSQDQPTTSQATSNGRPAGSGARPKTAPKWFKLGKR